MPFETALSQAQVAGFETPLLAIALARGTLPPSLAAFDKATGGALARLLAAGDFTGKKDEAALVYPPGPAARVLLVGLGKADEIVAPRHPPRRRHRGQAGALARRPSRGVPPRRRRRRGKVAPAEAGQAIAEGLAQGAWQFNEMKRPPERARSPRSSGSTCWRPTGADAIASRAPGRSGHRRGADALRAASRCCRATSARPPTWRTRREELAQRHGFGVTVLDKAAIVREKMGALMAVAQGSAEEPRFIALEYKGARGRAGGAGRQGRHLRHRRHLDQAGPEHGGHEVRHVRRGRRARHLRGARAGSSRRCTSWASSPAPRTCRRAPRSSRATW